LVETLNTAQSISRVVVMYVTYFAHVLVLHFSRIAFMTLCQTLTAKFLHSFFALRNVGYV